MGPTCNSATSSSAAPYSQSKFRSVIDNSERLQVQTTSTCLDRADMQGNTYDPDNWRLAGTAMEFVFDDGEKGERVELRGNSFDADETRTLSGRVTVDVSGKSDGFTIAQVFGETDGKPILRIEMIGERRGVTNHIWGIYRTSAGSDNVTEFKDLGPAPTGGVNFTIKYNDDDKISATFGRVTQTFSTNFSYWNASTKETYFKAGCYLQDPGDCRVRYGQLSW